MYTKRIVNKVPGKIPTESKEEKQGFIGDLSSKTVPQLNELLDRQLKLLANKPFITKLADKGMKITSFKETLETEIQKRKKDESLSNMLSALSLNEKTDLEALEWTGDCAPGHVTKGEDRDSEEEQDALKILASHSGAGFHKKKLKVVKLDDPLIKPSDLESEGEVLEEYAKMLCEKFDSVKEDSKKTKFFPFKTLNTAKLEDKVQKKISGRWEVTAATPPAPVHGDTKLVSLQESIHLQCEQQQKLKEVQMKHAAERLRQSWSTSQQVPSALGPYREPHSPSTSSSEDEDSLSDQEVHDEEHPDGGGITIYNLVDDVGHQ